MSLNSEVPEISGILERLLDNMSRIVSSEIGRDGAQLRSDIGDIRSNFYTLIVNGTFPTRLLECFTNAQEAGATLVRFVPVHDGLLDERPVGEFSSAIVQMAILFCLSIESRIAAAIEFVSRDDVEVLMNSMKTTFDKARLLSADSLDTSSYQRLTDLAGALTDHLSSIARPLARMVTFNLKAVQTTIAISQYVYYTGDRWEEIVNENKIIHPAFCPKTIRGLSS